MRFFDRYDRFYETTATLLKPNRFEQRWRMIIEQNVASFRGARVLDLASHDGRWSFAALKAGAAYVEGVEGRPELVEAAKHTFRSYDIDERAYNFHAADCVRYLANPQLERFDVVLNLGFFYHTLRHMEIVENMARAGAAVIVIDTEVLAGEAPMIAVRREPVSDQRNAIDHRGLGDDTVPVGRVSRSALALMLGAVGYDLAELDWRTSVDDFSECADYASGDRGTFVARRRA